MATKKTNAVESVEESKSAQERSAEAEREDMIAEVIGILPAPEKLRLRQQNSLMKLQLELMPVFEKMYDRDENGDIIRDENGDAQYSPDANRAESAMALADMAAEVDAWAESIATNQDAYVSWAEGKSADYFLAILTYYRQTSGE